MIGILASLCPLQVPGRLLRLNTELYTQALVMTAVLGYKAVARHPEDYHHPGYCFKETSQTKALTVEGEHETSQGTGKVWVWGARDDF